MGLLKLEMLQSTFERFNVGNFADNIVKIMERSNKSSCLKAFNNIIKRCLLYIDEELSMGYVLLLTNVEHLAMNSLRR